MIATLATPEARNAYALRDIVGTMFSTQRKNTLEIADTLRLPEPVVYNALGFYRLEKRP